MTATTAHPARRAMVSARLAPGELDAVRTAAAAQGESVSQFLRRAALTAADATDPGAVLVRLLQALAPVMREAAAAYAAVCRPDVIAPEYDRGRAHALDELHRAAHRAYWAAVAVADGPTDEPGREVVVR
jgi:hypothetical protein